MSVMPTPAPVVGFCFCEPSRSSSFFTRSVAIPAFLVVLRFVVLAMVVDVDLIAFRLGEALRTGAGSPAAPGCFFPFGILIQLS